MKIGHKILILCMVLVVTLTGCGRDKKEKFVGETAESPEISIIEAEPVKTLKKADKILTSDELVELYITDKEWLKEIVEHKTIEIIGEVDEVNYDIFGENYVDIGYKGKSDITIRCYLEETIDPTDLKKGDSIRIVGDVLSIGNVYIELVDSDYIDN